MDRFDICIAGAGVVGLAIAHRLLEAFPKASIVLTEQESGFGQHTSGSAKSFMRVFTMPPAASKPGYALKGKRPCMLSATNIVCLIAG